MQPELYVIIAIVSLLISVGVPLIVKELRDIRETFGKEVKDIQKSTTTREDEMRKSTEVILGKCDNLRERITITETKLDMILDNSGFDVHKVNKAIKENMEELKKNDKPSIGCINTKELRKEGG